MPTNDVDPARYKEGDRPVPGYTLVKLLGRGSSGEAWQVQSDDGNEAALKIVNLRNQSRLQVRELDAIRKLKNARHNCLVGIHHVWLKDRDGNLRDTDGRLIDTGIVVKRTSPGNLSTGPIGPFTGTMVPSSSKGSDGVAVTQSPPIPAAHSPVSPGGRTIDAEEDHHNQVSAPTCDASQPDSTETPHPQTTKPKSGSSGSSGVDIAITGDVRKSLTDLFIVMSLGEMTLGGLLAREKSLGKKAIPFDVLRQYMLDAARGIDFLNRDLKLQHCDIKPENILIISNGAQICDCGLARETVQDQNSTSLVNGLTREFAAPEQFKRREQNYGHGTDQYSLANTYYYLRTGTNIYKPSAEDWEIKAAKCTGAIDLSSPLIGREERAALARALLVAPEKRYISATAMMTAVVEGYQQDHQPRPASRWPLLLATAAVLVALLTGAAVVWGPGILDGMSEQQVLAEAKELPAIAGVIEAGEFAQATVLYEQLPTNELRVTANDLLLDKLDHDAKMISPLDCAAIRQLKERCLTVDRLFQQHDSALPSQSEKIDALIADLQRREQGMLPPATRDRLETLVAQGDWPAALRIADEAISARDSCVEVHPHIIRNRAFSAWLANLQKSQSADLLDERERLAKLEQHLVSTKFTKSFGQMDELVARRLKLWEAINARAQERVRQTTDWQPALQDWQALILHCQELEQVSAEWPKLGREDQAQHDHVSLDARLGRLLVEVRISGGTPAASDALARSKPLLVTDIQRARWNILHAMLLAQQGASLEAIVTALAQTQPLRSHLIAWEEQQFSELADKLAGQIENASDGAASLSPAKREQLQQRLAKLIPDRALQRLLRQISDQFKRGAPLPEVQASLKALDDLIETLSSPDRERAADHQRAFTRWAEVLDGRLNLADAADFQALYLAMTPPAVTALRDDMAAAIVTRAQSLSPEEQDGVLVQLLAKEKTPDHPIALRRAADVLVDRRLVRNLVAGVQWKQIADDAERLLSQDSTSPEAPMGCSRSTVASAWLEAQLMLNHKAVVEADIWKQRRELVQSSELDDEWSSYRQYAIALVDAASSVEAWSSILSSKEYPAWLQPVVRRERLAGMLWKSIAAHVPNDADLTPPANADQLRASLEQLQRLLDADTMSPKLRPRIETARVIVEYYLPANARHLDLPQIAQQATELLANNDTLADLRSNDLAPPCAKHLQHVAAMASIALLSHQSIKPSQWTAELQQAVHQASTALTDVMQFRFLDAKEPFKGADLQAYANLVAPVLAVVATVDRASPPPAIVRRDLASLYAAQARLIERGDAVRHDLDKQGLKTHQVDNLCESAYECALELEEDPQRLARLALHLACRREDQGGELESLTESLESDGPGSLRALSQGPVSFHGGKYVDGLHELLAGRKWAANICDVAGSRREQAAAVARANAAFEQALKTLKAAPPAEQSLYATRYQIAMTTVLVEQAFTVTNTKDKATLLEEAVQQAGLAITSAKDDPINRYFAYISQGNAYEDLAFYCEQSAKYELAEACFKKAIGNTAIENVVLPPRYVGEYLYHLGRCQKRRAEHSSDKNARRAVLLEARQNLESAAKELADSNTRLAIEAKIFCGDTYVAEISFDLDEATTDQQRRAAYRPQLALDELQLYGEAVALAKDKDPTRWSRYQAKYIGQIWEHYKFESQFATVDPTQPLTQAASEKHRLLLKQATDLTKAATGPEFEVLGSQRATAIRALCGAQSLAEDATGLRARLAIYQKHESLFDRPSGCDDMVFTEAALLEEQFRDSLLLEVGEVSDYWQARLVKMADAMRSDPNCAPKVHYLDIQRKAVALRKLGARKATQTPAAALTLCNDLVDVAREVRGCQQLVQNQQIDEARDVVVLGLALRRPLQSAAKAPDSAQKLATFKSIREVLQSAASFTLDREDLKPAKPNLDNWIKQLDTWISALDAKF